MKKLILIISLSLAFQNLKSQSYIPMIEDSMIVVNVIWSFNTTKDDYKKYKYIGDTTINSFPYYKCYSDTNLKDSSFLITPAMKYYGAIREVNKKIYFLKKDSLFERKIYDFSVNLYDTTNVFYSTHFTNKYYDCYYYKMEDTLSSFIPRKSHFYKILDPLMIPINIIAEGFGNIEYNANEIEMNFRSKKVCNIRKNSSNNNIPANYSDCYRQIVNSFISVKELNLEKQIKLFPNPTKNKIKITSEKELINSIFILTIQGKIIKNYKFNSLENTINIESLSKGIYLIKIQTNKETVVKKIIKE